MKELFEAIKGARFFSMTYHAIGKVRGGLLKDDAVTEFQAQVFSHGTALRRSVEDLERLDVAGLYAGLSRGVLVRDYRIPKKDGGGIVTEVLTVADLEVARLEEIKKLIDPNRSAHNHQADTWKTVSTGIYEKKATGKLFVRGYKVPGSSKTITEPANGYHIANSTREARAAEVIRRWMRAGGMRSWSMDRVLTLSAGGQRWERGPDGLLRAC